MRNIIILISFFVAIVGCSAPKTPEFKKVKNARVTNANGKIYTISADAVYHNPNSIGGTLTGMEMDISVDDIEITHLSQTKSAVVQPETDFIVPITFDVDIQKVIGENTGFLKGMLDKLLKDEVEINYKGHLNVEFLNAEFKVPVEYTEAMSLGVNFD